MMKIDEASLRQALVNAAPISPITLPSSTQAWSRLEFRLRHRRHERGGYWESAATLAASLMLLAFVVAAIGLPSSIAFSLAGLFVSTGIAAFTIGSARIV